MQSLATYRAQSIARFGHTATWRIVLGMVGITGLFFLASVLAVAGYFLIVAALGGVQTNDLNDLLAEPGAILAVLLGFVGAHLGVVAFGPVLHKRGYLAFWGPTPAFRPRAFSMGILVVFAVLSTLTALSLLSASPTQQLTLPIWAAFLLPALIALLLQTSAEELVFRGYLQPLLATRFQSPFIWFLIPAILFGAVHWQPGIFGANAWLVVVAATLIGLITADVTARTGNISAAIGLHFANNAFGLLLIATPGPLSGLGLYLNTTPPTDIAATRIGLIANIAIFAIAYAIWLFWLRRGRLLSPGTPTI